MPDAGPRASVIIVNYNGKEVLEPCLSSLSDSLGSQDEILLFDNASTDGSPDFIEQSFPHIRVIRSKENLGFGSANNLAARQAAGQYLAFLNPDTTVEPGWLEALISILGSDPTIGLATSKILQMDDPDRVSGCGNEVHISGLALGRGMGMHRDAFPEIEDLAAISGASFAARKDVFEAVGGFDGDFFMYVEDTDLSFRTRLAGYRLVHVPQSVVYHDYTLSFGPQKTFYQERNRYVMLLKNLRWPTLLLLLPALILAEVVTWGFVLLREKRNLRNKLDAYRWILTHWPEIMAKRRQVQASRRARDRDLLARMTHRLAYEQTGTGVLTVLARLVFDPLFFLCHRLALIAVWW
jgi:GT2 family glycosyltransferase